MNIVVGYLAEISSIGIAVGIAVMFAIAVFTILAAIFYGPKEKNETLAWGIINYRTNKLLAETFQNRDTARACKLVSKDKVIRVKIVEL